MDEATWFVNNVKMYNSPLKLKRQSCSAIYEQSNAGRISKFHCASHSVKKFKLETEIKTIEEKRATTQNSN